MLFKRNKRKKAKWILYTNSNGDKHYVCSNCNQFALKDIRGTSECMTADSDMITYEIMFKHVPVQSKFCPHCGAEMEGGKE